MFGAGGGVGPPSDEEIIKVVVVGADPVLLCNPLVTSVRVFNMNGADHRPNGSTCSLKYLPCQNIPKRWCSAGVTGQWQNAL